MKIEDVLRYELSPIPTAYFHERGAMKTAKNKSDLNWCGEDV